MTITALPTPPSRSAPSTFSALADAFLAALPTFVTQANALEANVNIKEATVVEKEILCTAAALVALAASNYKGAWSAQSGPATVPYAVSHLSQYWQLVSNLADVTTKTPGTDPEWMQIGGITKSADAVLSGTPVILTIKGSDGVDYYVKGYPTKT